MDVKKVIVPRETYAKLVYVYLPYRRTLSDALDEEKNKRLLCSILDQSIGASPSFP